MRYFIAFLLSLCSLFSVAQKEKKVTIKQYIIVDGKTDSIVTTFTVLPDTVKIIVPPVHDTIYVPRDTCLAPPPVNNPPSANAGSDKSITLPVNSISITGVGTDQDGTVTAYNWSKIGGPAQYTIINGTTPTATFSNLVNGLYTFRFTVMDDKGATGSDDVSITVNTATDTDGYPGYQRVYKNDFDAGTQLSSNQCGNCSISSTVFKSGNGSARFNYIKGQGQISGGFRSEQQYPGSYSPSNRDLIIEYDELFETVSTSCNGLSMQWHGGTQGTSGQMSMWITGKRFRPQYNTCGTAGCPNNYGPYISSIGLNQWYHFKWEIRFSTGSDGYARLYMDGVKVWDITGKNCDGSGQYPKIGINMFDGNNTTTVYFDNLRMYVK